VAWQLLAVHPVRGHTKTVLALCVVVVTAWLVVVAAVLCPVVVTAVLCPVAAALCPVMVAAADE